MHGVTVHVVPSEKKFVEELFDSLASIPTGQKALEDMKKYKVDFGLETSLGRAGGYCDPENNQIVMAKSLGMDFMEFALVHEARHLWQNNTGYDELRPKNLDFASYLMIDRATEADAQVQALQACLEWQEKGHDAPMKRFELYYRTITDAYAKNHSLSDAYKGWFDDERVTAYYEQRYDVEEYLYMLNRSFVEKAKEEPLPEYVSLKPADIAKFCGGERVDGFEEFTNSTQARQVHLLTKTCIEMYDTAVVALGGPADPSLANVPVRDLKGNSSAQINADKYVKQTLKDFRLIKAEHDNNSKDPRVAVAKAVKAVAKINQASINGTVDEKASADLQASKTLMKDIVAPKKSAIAQKFNNFINFFTSNGR